MKKLIDIKGFVRIIVIALLIVLAMGCSNKDINKDQSIELEKTDKVEGAIQEEKQNEEVVSTLEQQIQEEEALVIETDYCRLYYPQKWEENLLTEIVNDSGYKVVFYGIIEGKEAEKLFEILFNCDADEIIGTVEINGESVYVGFNLSGLELGDDWSEEEKNIIFAMQEDLNYIIGMLQKEAGFKREMS